MANTVIYQKRGNDKVKVAETPDLSPYAIKADVDAELATKADAEDLGITDKRVDNIAALLNGALSVQQTDSTSAYSKTAPAKAQPYAAVEQIGGRTVCWNQLLNDSSSSVLSYANCTGTYTASTHSYNCTVSADDASYTGLQFGISTIEANHKLLCAVIVSGATFTNTPTKVQFLFRGTQNTGSVSIDYTGNGTYFAISETTVAVNRASFYMQCTTKTGDTFTLGSFMVFDLTLMFGAGNEPATVDAFRAMYPASYYAYNPGQLISAGVTGAVSRGKNLLDYTQGLGTPSSTAATNVPRFFEMGKYYVGIGVNNVWSTSTICTKTDDTFQVYNSTSAGYGFGVPFECSEGVSYSVSAFFVEKSDVSASCLLAVNWYNNQGEKVGFNFTSYTTNVVGTRQETAFTAPSGAVVGVGCIIPNILGLSVTVSDIMVRKTATTTSTYTPYMTSTLPIPAAVQSLPGYGWSAWTSDGTPDVYNGLSFTSKTYTQRIAKYEFDGTETITLYATGDNYNTFVMYAPNLGRKGGWNCPYRSSRFQDFKTVVWGSVWQSANGYGWVVYLPTTYTSADAVKTWLAEQKTAGNPVTFQYELATPSVTDISQYLTDDNLLAVEPGGTVSFPSILGDDYRLPVPSGVEYTIDLAPDTPSTDGTYTLQCTVADGVATYEWVSA